jgi:hypothetical protein
MPHVTFFSNKLCGDDDLSKHDIFVCFMCVAIHCFLCPSSNEYPSGKYLAVLKQPETVKGYDFSKLVYEHCLASINEFSFLGNLRGRRPRAPVCCIYVLVVSVCVSAPIFFIYSFNVFSLFHSSLFLCFFISCDFCPGALSRLLGFRC